MNFKRIISLAIATLIVSTTMTGCNDSQTVTSSSTASTGSSTSSQSSSAETEIVVPETVSWITLLHTESPASDEVVGVLSEIVGAELEFTWMHAATAEEKFTASLASKKLADIVTLPSTLMSNTTVKTALKSGMFWDIEPYLDQFENLAKINEERIDASRINGKLYGVPMLKPSARYGVVIRQDWLDNLELEAPRTFEDLVLVAKAFTEDDPDQNGKDDTTGFADRSESFNLTSKMIAGWHGAPNNFEILEDGTVSPYFMNENFFLAAEAYREVYENGWMNQNFIEMPKNDQKNFVVQGKAGIVVTGLYDAKNYYNAAVETGQEGTMKWTMINDLTANGQERRILSDTNGGLGGLLAIPTTEVKTEEELLGILSVLDKLASKEAFLLMTNGIEGVHYEIKDEIIVNLDKSKWTQEVQALSGSRPNELYAYEFKVADPLSTISNQLILENEPYAVYNEAQSFESEAYDQNWNFLIDIVKDAYYKYIIGDIDMDALRAAVEEWRTSGGQQIMDEFTASNKALAK